MDEDAELPAVTFPFSLSWERIDLASWIVVAKPMPLAPLDDRGVDPDDLAHEVEEAPARVPRV